MSKPEPKEIREFIDKDAARIKRCLDKTIAEASPVQISEDDEGSKKYISHAIFGDSWVDFKSQYLSAEHGAKEFVRKHHPHSIHSIAFLEQPSERGTEFYLYIIFIMLRPPFSVTGVVEFLPQTYENNPNLEALSKQAEINIAKDILHTAIYGPYSIHRVSAGTGRSRLEEVSLQSLCEKTAHHLGVLHKEHHIGAEKIPQKEDAQSTRQ